VEAVVPIRRRDDWNALYCRAYESTAGLFVEACRLLKKPGFSPIELREEELGRLYTSPNLRQYLKLHAKVLARKASAWWHPDIEDEPLIEKI